MSLCLLFSRTLASSVTCLPLDSIWQPANCYVPLRLCLVLRSAITEGILQCIHGQQPCTSKLVANVGLLLYGNSLLTSRLMFRTHNDVSNRSFLFLSQLPYYVAVMHDVQVPIETLGTRLFYHLYIQSVWVIMASKMMLKKSRCLWQQLVISPEDRVH